MKFSEMKYERPDLEAIKSELRGLTEQLRAAQDYAQAREVFLRHEKASIHMQTLATLASVRHQIDTRDAFYDAEETFWNAASPELEEYEDAWKGALLESPFRKEFEEELGNLMFVNAELARKAFSPEIIPECQQENDLSQAYSKLIASAQPAAILS